MLPTIFLDKKIRYHYDKINKEKIKPNKKGEIQVASDEVFIKCNKKKSFGYYLLNIFFASRIEGQGVIDKVALEAALYRHGQRARFRFAVGGKAIA